MSYTSLLQDRATIKSGTASKDDMGHVTIAYNTTVATGVMCRIVQTSAETLSPEDRGLDVHAAWQAWFPAGTSISEGDQVTRASDSKTFIVTGVLDPARTGKYLRVALEEAE